VKIVRARLDDAFTVELEKQSDERGFFARAWCAHEFESTGRKISFVQASISSNISAGTARGMHYQRPPGKEGKFIRCISGGVFDVIVDLRPESETFLQYESFELTAENGRALFAPPGFAHGFQTLVDNTNVFYEMTDYFQPDQGSGFRFDDPLLNIELPLQISCISRRDQTYSDIDPMDFECFKEVDSLLG